MRELRARLAAAGADASGCTEKDELVELLLQHQGGQPAASEQRSGGSGVPDQQAQQSGGQGAAAGQQRPRKLCLACGGASGPQGQKLKLCAGCREAYFCSVACQRMAWEQHRAACQAAQAGPAAAAAAAGDAGGA